MYTYYILIIYHKIIYIYTLHVNFFFIMLHVDLARTFDLAKNTKIYKTVVLNLKIFNKNILTDQRSYTTYMSNLSNIFTSINLRINCLHVSIVSSHNN